MKIKRYKIIKLLGEGGMGSVFLAEDIINSNRLTAIKTIKPEFIKDPKRLVHFKHEYEIMSRLNHPNLAQVYDFGLFDDDGGYYLAMEYINGRELIEFIREDKKLDFETALPIVINILRAMEFVHSRNIIHSDIKPQNILITEDNQVKLIDFGLSDFGDKASKKIKGTIKYLAPEIINGSGKDHRADIFSLGVLFYEMLSDELFYSDSSINSIVSKLSSKNEYISVVDLAFKNIKEPRIRAIIERMCAFDLKDRFSSCADVIIALNKAFDLKIPIETEETKEAYITGVPFTAREKELKHLESFLESKENKLILVTGKHGVGKSRLLVEFKKQCKLSGVAFFEGSSLRGESYELFLPMLSEILFSFGNNISAQNKKSLHNLLPTHPLLASIIDEKEIEDPKTLKDILVQAISSILIDYACFVKDKVVIVFNNFCNADEISLEIVNEILFKINNHNLSNLKLFAECQNEEQNELADFLTGLQDKERLKVVKISDFSENEVSDYIKNTFGERFIGQSFSKKMSEIYNYCGGNPFFIQESLKAMVYDGIISRDERFWELKGSVSSAKFSHDLKSLIKRRVDNLKLPNKYLRGLLFISFSNQDKLSVNFFQQFAQDEINIKWQNLFDLLVKKEFLIFRDGYFSQQNQIFKDVLHQDLDENEIADYHKLWATTVEKQCPANVLVEEINNEQLFDLGYYYLNSKYTSVDIFLNKTAKFLLELGKREKAKYANKTAISYFTKLLNEIEKYDQNSEAIQNLKALVCYNLANIYNLVGKWDRAEELYLKVHDLSIKNDNKKMLVETKSHLSRLISDKGRTKEAMSLLAEAKSIAESTNDRKLYSTVIGNFGVEYWRQGDYDNAMLCYAEQKQLSIELEDRFGYSRAIGNMGLVYWNKGDLDQAMQCYEEQKKISLEIGDKRNYSMVIGNIGNIYNSKGDYDKAIKFYEERKDLCIEIGDKNGYASIIGNIGNVYCVKGDYEMSMLCYQKKKLICSEMGDKRGYSVVLSNMGTVYQAQEDFKKAMECYTEAIEICSSLKFKALLCYVLNSKANLLFVIKDYDNAKIICQEANLLSAELNNDNGVFDSMILNSKLLALENPSAAVLQLNQMLESETEESNEAAIHYEIYRINQSEDYRQKVLQLYQSLYATTPNYEYKEIIEELTGA